MRSWPIKNALVVIVGMPILLLCTTVPGNAQTVALDPAQPFKANVDHIEEKLQEVIMSLGSESRQTIFDAGQQALVAIQNLQYTADYSSEKLLKDVTDGPERTILNDALFVTNDLSGKLAGPIHELDVSAQRIENSVSRLPLSDRSPRVVDYSPRFVASMSRVGSTVFVLRGSLLNAGDPFLWMNGKRYSPVSRDDSRLEFMLPNSELFNGSKGVGYHRLDLTLYQARSGGFLSTIYDPKSYRMTIFRLPSLVGSMKITAIRKYERTVTEDRSQAMMVRSPHGEGADAECIQVTARPGWLIDTSTISFTTEYSNHGQYDGIKNASTAGFCLALRAEGWGRVSTFFGVIDAGQQGVQQGRAAWKEYRVTNDPENVPIAGSESVFWGHDYKSYLPDHSVGYIIEMVLYDGRSLVLNGAPGDGLLTVVFDDRSGLLVVRPNDPNKILL